MKTFSTEWKDRYWMKKKSSSIGILTCAFGFILFTFVHICVAYDLFSKNYRSNLFLRLQFPTQNHENKVVASPAETISQDQLTVSISKENIYIGSWKNLITPKEAEISFLKKENWEADFYSVLSRHKNAEQWAKQNAIVFVFQEKFNLKNLYDLTYNARYSLSKLKEKHQNVSIDPNLISISFLDKGKVQQ